MLLPEVLLLPSVVLVLILVCNDVCKVDFEVEVVVLLLLLHGSLNLDLVVVVAGNTTTSLLSLLSLLSTGLSGLAACSIRCMASCRERRRSSCLLVFSKGCRNISCTCDL